MTRRLVITVDTETGNFPNGQGVWGRVGGEEWGLRRLLQVFRELALPATFFLDAYPAAARDIAEHRKAAELIVAAGHDLQLHTHPAPSFDPRRTQLRDYTLAEQIEIVAYGTDRIEQWSGQRPTLHRAGDWAANHDSLKALRSCGLRADFSASAWSKACDLDKRATHGNGWTRLEGLLCGVGTCYRDGLTGRIRRVDLGGASLPEVLDILSRRIEPFFLTLHSFSLLRYNRARTRFSANGDYVERLGYFCSEAVQRWGYELSTASQAVDSIEQSSASTLPWDALPTTRLGPSCAGLMKSIGGRITP